MKKNIIITGATSGIGLETTRLLAGKGYGKALLKHLAQLAVERNCGRMEWICLDWNQPAIKVYRSIGAIPMDEWTVQRLDETALKKFASE